MGYTRSQTFVPGAFLRSCDVCGIRYRSHELRRGEDGFWRCVKYCVEIPALTRDKISAESQRRKEAPPPPHGIAFDTKETYAEEAIAFDFLAVGRTQSLAGGAAPNTSWQVNNGNPVFASNGFAYAPYLATSSNWRYSAYAEAGRYLANLIIENKRPARWIAQAKAKLRALADSLITIQVGIGSNLGTTQVSPFWGELNITADQVHTAANAQAGLLFMHAYLALGDAKYLTSAYASASFLRNVQSCGAASSAFFTSSNSGGTLHLYTGGLIACFQSGSANIHVFDSSTCLPALELWYLLYKASGDQLIGCTASLGVAVPSQLLSQSIADLRAFISVGAFDVFSGTTLTGWSATTPREKFNAYPTGTGSWEYADGNASAGTAITGTNVALALRSLYNYEGYSSQVSSIWKWLMGFGSNAAFQCGAGTLAIDYACASTTLAANPPAPQAGQGNVVAPAYDPTLALATLLTVNGVNANRNGSSLYDWSTTGMLAGIQSSQNMSAFRTAKTKMSTPVLRMPVAYSDTAAGPVLDYPMLRGVSGLAMQLNFGDSGSAMYWNCISAARCAGAFRYQPQAWTGTNPPQQQPGVTAG